MQRILHEALRDLSFAANLKKRRVLTVKVYSGVYAAVLGRESRLQLPCEGLAARS